MGKEKEYEDIKTMISTVIKLRSRRKRSNQCKQCTLYFRTWQKLQLNGDDDRLFCLLLELL